MSLPQAGRCTSARTRDPTGHITDRWHAHVQRSLHWIVAGNRGNTLQLENTAAFQASAFRLAPDNLLKIEGDYSAIGNLLSYLGSTELQTWDAQYVGNCRRQQSRRPDYFNVRLRIHLDYPQCRRVPR
jgi:hypothetical protein